jgi:hypothetical protein
VIIGKICAEAENRFTSDKYDYVIERCIELYVLIVNDLSTDLTWEVAACDQN